MKYTEQDLKDEHEQAVKRKGELYAEGYIEGLKDSQNKALTTPVVVEEKELFCHHEGSYTLKEDGTCCKCHRLSKY
jgi:hypothetical protein